MSAYSRSDFSLARKSTLWPGEGALDLVREAVLEALPFELLDGFVVELRVLFYHALLEQVEVVEGVERLEVLAVLGVVDSDGDCLRELELVDADLHDALLEQVFAERDELLREARLPCGP